MPVNATTRLSTKGQLILPKAVRDSFALKPGTAMSVETTADSIVLKPILAKTSRFPLTRFEDVAGSVRYDGPPMTIEDMDAAILDGAGRRFARD